ncbi:hypothetical protein AGMMS49531_05510 [Endomicrobiia bacterium]|nr:hypothetical protein AGMMS49531_05510 [Endomicrobiia bacterium]
MDDFLKLAAETNKIIDEQERDQVPTWSPGAVERWKKAKMKKQDEHAAEKLILDEDLAVAMAEVEIIELQSKLAAEMRRQHGGMREKGADVGVAMINEQLRTAKEKINTIRDNAKTDDELVVDGLVLDRSTRILRALEAIERNNCAANILLYSYSPSSSSSSSSSSGENERKVHGKLIDEREKEKKELTEELEDVQIDIKELEKMLSEARKKNEELEKRLKEREDLKKKGNSTLENNKKQLQDLETDVNKTLDINQKQLEDLEIDGNKTPENKQKQLNDLIKERQEERKKEQKEWDELSNDRIRAFNAEPDNDKKDKIWRELILECSCRTEIAELKDRLFENNCELAVIQNILLLGASETCSLVEQINKKLPAAADIVERDDKISKNLVN